MAESENQEAERAYIAVTQAVKLIPRPFEGNPKELREFIEGVESALEVTRPTKRELLLKFL